MAFFSIFILLGGFDIIPFWLSFFIVFSSAAIQKFLFTIHLYKKNVVEHECEEPKPFTSSYMSNMVQMAYLGYQQKPNQAKVNYLVMFLLFFTVLIPLMTVNSCVVDHNEGLEGGIMLPGEYTYSSTFLRLILMKKECPLGAPCHAYITLPEESSRMAFFTIHTNQYEDTFKISYGISG